MDRRERILAGLALDGLGLEVGAGHAPLVAGDPGLKVKALDYVDQAGLIAKYEGMGMDTSRIPHVDYVWSGQRYADLVADARFDWIVASHVIEHVPDIVGFINECAEILAPGGRLSLVVPDRRWEFDYYRPSSGLGSVIDAHLQKRRMSSPGLAAEFGLYMCQLNGQDTWAPGEEGTPLLRHDDSVAASLLEHAQSDQYVDIHAWVFTAHGFRLIIEDLHRLGLLKLREATFHAPNGFEFYIQLSADGAGPGLSRQELCERAMEETRSLEPPATMAEAANEALLAQNAILRREVEALRASTSWRITAPVRALRRAFKSPGASQPG